MKVENRKDWHKRCINRYKTWMLIAFKNKNFLLAQLKVHFLCCIQKSLKLSCKNILCNYIQNLSLQGNIRCCIKSFWNPLTYEEIENHIFWSTFLRLSTYMIAESLHMSFGWRFFVVIAKLRFFLTYYD